MKYAVIGTGRTGQAILESLPPEDVVAICNSRNVVTREKLGAADVGIVFVPGQAFSNLIPLFLDVHLPLVIGSTGLEWPKDLDAILRARKRTWITGQNFSLGLNVMRFYAQKLRHTLTALRPGALQLSIEETHHIHKKDAPSGTALYLAHALEFAKETVVSRREGEVKGQHKVTFGWPSDQITLIHDALDRSIYAEGVRLACAQVKSLPPGLHNFEKISDTLIETAAKG